MSRRNNSASKTFSVIVPTTGKSPDYLRETIQSVISAAAFSDLVELTVVENGGPLPQLDEIFLSFPAECVRRISFPEMLPMGENWNRCLKLGHAEWIHLLHDDDFVHSDFYQAFSQTLDNLSFIPDIIISAASRVDDSGNDSNHRYAINQSTGEILRAGLGILCAHSAVSCPAVIVNRNSYTKFGSFNTSLKYGMDWECWGRISIQGRGYYIDENLCYYRMHSMNATHQFIRSPIYQEIQTITIRLHRLFRDRFGEYPVESFHQFAWCHAKATLSHSIKNRDVGNLFKAVKQIIFTLFRLTIPHGMSVQLARFSPRNSSAPSEK